MNNYLQNLDETIQKYLKDDIQYYDEDTITNVSITFRIEELIREKVLYFTKEEVPHAVTCIVEDIREDKKAIEIIASLIVDRENLKKILIGSGGSMIKKIGTNARKDIEQIFAKKVYLDLQVKVVPNWRDKDAFLNQQLNLKEFNEK